MAEIQEALTKHLLDFEHQNTEWKNLSNLTNFALDRLGALRKALIECAVGEHDLRDAIISETAYWRRRYVVAVPQMLAARELVENTKKRVDQLQDDFRRLAGVGQKPPGEIVQ